MVAVNVFYSPLWAALWRLSAHSVTAPVIVVFYNPLSFSLLWPNALRLHFSWWKSPPLNYTCSQRLLQFVIVPFFVRNARHCTTRLTNLIAHNPILFMRAAALHLKLTYWTSRFRKSLPLHYTFSQPIAILKVRQCTTPVADLLYNPLS